MPAPTTATKSGPLAGKVFCLTGKFSVGKSEYHSQILAKGGAYEDDFRSNVTTVVSADTSKLTGKLKKAKDKGLEVIDEAQLQELLS